MLPPGKAKGISAERVAFSPTAVHRLSHDVQAAIVEAFARSLHVVFLLAIPLCVASIPLLWILRELPLRTDDQFHCFARDYRSERIDK